MKRIECELEAEVLAAVFESRWPDRVSEELRSHASHCEICSDVAAVSLAIGESQAQLVAEAAVPDASRVWRRAQVRARREAVEAAGRPITAAQVIAFACAMGLLGACYGATSAWFQGALGRIASNVAGFDKVALLAAATQMLMDHSPLIIGLVAAVFLVPTFFYVALGRD